MTKSEQLDILRASFLVDVLNKKIETCFYVNKEFPETKADFNASCLKSMKSDIEYLSQQINNILKK